MKFWSIFGVSENFAKSFNLLVFAFSFQLLPLLGPFVWAGFVSNLFEFFDDECAGRR